MDQANVSLIRKLFIKGRGAEFSASFALPTFHWERALERFSDIPWLVQLMAIRILIANAAMKIIARSVLALVSPRSIYSAQASSPFWTSYIWIWIRIRNPDTFTKRNPDLDKY